MLNTLVPDFDILQVGIRICIGVDPDYEVSVVGAERQQVRKRSLYPRACRALAARRFLKVAPTETDPRASRAPKWKLE